VLSLTQTPLQSDWPPGQVHAPPEHVPPEHPLPQAPQLVVLVCRSTHCPLQNVLPAGHAVQLPLTHEPPAHWLPQVPQLLQSVNVLTHLPLQAVGVEPEHSRPQVAPLQVADPVPDEGPGQTLPQAPQLFLSLLSLTQVPLHPVYPEPQQVPLLHEFCPVHLVPQAPQLLLSVFSLTHLVPHRVCPVGQPARRPKVADGSRFSGGSSGTPPVSAVRGCALCTAGVPPFAGACSCSDCCRLDDVSSAGIPDEQPIPMAAITGAIRIAKKRRRIAALIARAPGQGFCARPPGWSQRAAAGARAVGAGARWRPACPAPSQA
jgi:hypothetical protein